MRLIEYINNSIELLNEAKIPDLKYIGDTFGLKGKTITFDTFKGLKDKIEAFKELYGEYPDINISGNTFMDADYGNSNFSSYYFADYDKMKIGAKYIEIFPKKGYNELKKRKLELNDDEYTKEITFYYPSFSKHGSYSNYVDSVLKKGVI